MIKMTWFTGCHSIYPVRNLTEPSVKEKIMQITTSDPRVQMAARIMDFASNLSTRQHDLITRFIDTTLDRLPSTESPDIKINDPQIIGQRLDQAFAERNAKNDWDYQVWSYHFR